MGLGGGIDEVKVLSVMLKLADAVSDPRRLEALRSERIAWEKAARAAGVADDLVKAREEVTKARKESQELRRTSAAERETALGEITDMREKARAEIDAEKKALAEREAVLAENTKALEAGVTENTAETNALAKKRADLENEESRLNDWNEQLKREADRLSGLAEIAKSLAKTGG